jgi:hypothetical protein
MIIENRLRLGAFVIQAFGGRGLEQEVGVNKVQHELRFGNLAFYIAGTV